MRRRLRPATLIAAIDVMICFAGILLMMQQQPKLQAGAEEEARKDRQRQQELAERENEQMRPFMSVLEGVGKAVVRTPPKPSPAPVPAPIPTPTEPEHTHGISHEEIKPEGTSLRLRSTGIYRDDRDGPMSRDEVVEWLRSLPPERVDMWEENGSNDQVIEMMDIDRDRDKLGIKVQLQGIILPSPGTPPSYSFDDPAGVQKKHKKRKGKGR